MTLLYSPDLRLPANSHWSDSLNNRQRGHQLLLGIGITTRLCQMETSALLTFLIASVIHGFL